MMIESFDQNRVAGKALLIVEGQMTAQKSKIKVETHNMYRHLWQSQYLYLFGFNLLPFRLN